MEAFNYSNILIELARAVKMHNFYPEGHPNLDSVLEKTFILFKSCLDSQNEIRWKIDQKGFYDGKAQIGAANPEIAGLAKRLFFRRVSELTFTPRLSMSDMTGLLNLIRLEPEDVQTIGGPEVFFAKQDVNGILLNALTYEDLKKLQKELEEKQEEETELAPESAQEALEEISPEEEEQKEPEPEPEKEDETLDTLLARVEKERDPITYRDISIRITEKTLPYVAEKNYVPAFRAALIFLKHSFISYGLPEEIRMQAEGFLDEILRQGILSYLVTRAGTKDDPEKQNIQRMLLKVGAPAIDPLLEALVHSSDASTRRNYFETALIFGEMLLVPAELRLKLGDWFTSRQMIALLGEIGDPASVMPLEEAYNSGDEKLKKEVLKSVVRIRSHKSLEMLIKALDEEDKGLVHQAIISLGILKDPGAIDVLGKIALSESFEAKKEAVKALGIIGDAHAVPYLSKVLFKKVWFGKKANEDVRSLAVTALGMIGGQEAYRAIEEACEDAEGEVYYACRRILEGREKTLGQNRPQ